MVNCAYGYQKETQEEEGEAEEGSAEEETGEEKAGEKEGASEKSSEKKGRSQDRNHPEKGGCTHQEAPAQKRTLLSCGFQRGASGSAGQSGDSQGLSRVQDVDSESVNELIEEGNAFEADVVQGVTDAGNADEEEVHTHEVPEDDVPGEYLDKD